MISQNNFLIGLVILTLVLFMLWRRTVRILKETKFAKNSLSTKYGKMTEQFMPFINKYPYDSHRFRFIGTPIDGIQFNDNEIIFIEFKSASSQLASNQRTIRDIIKSNKVRFQEIRI